jgi:hypothetical protein
MRVQHIQNEFTVKVYEAHARAAIKYGAPDFQEFNQSSTQLKDLYDAGFGDDESKAEFAGYLLLYHVYCKARYRYPSSVVTLSLCNPIDPRNLKNPESHAHALHLAMDANNWIRSLRLYESSPGLGKDLLRPVVAYIRVSSIRACCATSKTVPKSYLFQTLKFADEQDWSAFCTKFKLPFTDGVDAVDSKTIMQLMNEVFDEGTLWN